MAKVQINNLRVEYQGPNWIFARWEDDEGRRCHLGIDYSFDGQNRSLGVSMTTKGFGGQKGHWLYRNPPESPRPGHHQRTQLLDAFNAANKATTEEVLRIIDANGLVEKAISSNAERVQLKAAAERRQRIAGIREALGERRRRDDATPTQVAMYDFLMGREDDDLLELRIAFR